MLVPPDVDSLRQYIKQEYKPEFMVLISNISETTGLAYLQDLELKFASHFIGKWDT